MIEKSRFLHKEVFTKAGNLFFNELLAMMTSLTSFALSIELIRTGTSNLISIPQRQLKDEIVFPYPGATINNIYAFEAYQPLLSMANNQLVGEISFLIHEYRPAPTPSPDLYSVKPPWRFDQEFIGAFYISFYEAQLDAIHAKFSSDASTWPEDLNFARVIRNAYAHGGQIHFLNPRATSVSWMGLTYSPANNGHYIQSDIFIPEIIELMKLIDGHLK